jgi:D-3-phosphoglycerate dehydrogenase
VGLGNIGRNVAVRGRAFGMKVIAFDPYATKEAAAKLDVELVTDFDEMMARADVVTVHVPKTKDTTGLLDAAAFAKGKKGLLVINAARGGIVDEADLLEALNSGQVGGAALDVFVEEPPPADHPLLQHPNVICTPHLGASTEQAQVNVSVAVAEQICDYLLNNVVRNAINVPSISPELIAEVGPFLQLGEKLGRFLGQTCPGAIEQVEVEYAGEVAEMHVAPITIAVLMGMLESMRDSVNMVNAPTIAQELGIKVIESKVHRAEDFASSVSVHIKGCVERIIAGTIFHGGQPRIVRIDDYMLEAIPEGPTLFLQNRDEAGVVGDVGTILGEGNVNIARMQLALSPKRHEAAMLVNVDTVPSDEIMERLRSNPHMISAQLVEL